MGRKIQSDLGKDLGLGALTGLGFRVGFPQRDLIRALYGLLYKTKYKGFDTSSIRVEGLKGSGFKV